MRVERSAPQASVAGASNSARRPNLLAVLGALALLFGAAMTTYQFAFPKGLRATVHDVAVERGYGAHGIQPGGRIALKNAARRVASNLLDPPDLPTLVIDIKFKHLQTISAEKELGFCASCLFLMNDDQELKETATGHPFCWKR